MAKVEAWKERLGGFTGVAETVEVMAALLMVTAVLGSIFLSTAYRARSR